MEQRANATLGETIVIEQNVIAGVLEHIAKGLREGSLTAIQVEQEQQLNELKVGDSHMGFTPTGRFSRSLKYARKEALNG